MRGSLEICGLPILLPRLEGCLPIVVTVRGCNRYEFFSGKQGVPDETQFFQLSGEDAGGERHGAMFVSIGQVATWLGGVHRDAD